MQQDISFCVSTIQLKKLDKAFIFHLDETESSYAEDLSILRVTVGTTRESTFLCQLGAATFEKGISRSLSS